MERLRDMSPSTIATMYTVFSCVELVLLLQGFFISTVFIAVFSKIRSIHQNLILVFDSLLLSCSISSVIRICYLVQRIRGYLDVDPVVTFLRRFRIAAVYVGCLLDNIVRETISEPCSLFLNLGFHSILRSISVFGLHLLLLACERVLATIRSKTYENEKNIPVFTLFIFIMWCFSVAIVFLPHTSFNRTVIIAASFLVFYGISITLMIYVRTTNLNLWRKNRGSLEFSHVYQVRENVETAMTLFRCFVFIALQSFVGWSAIMISNVFRFLEPIPFLERVCGFIFDIDMGLSSTTIPLFLYLCSGKVNAAFKRHYSRIFQRKLKDSSSNNLVGLEGNQLKVDAKEEANVYFQQLQNAWG